MCTMRERNTNGYDFKGLCVILSNVGDKSCRSQTNTCVKKLIKTIKPISVKFIWTFNKKIGVIWSHVVI